MRRRPDHLKLIAGTARPDRSAPATAGVTATDIIPLPPPWMQDAVALAEWSRITKILSSCRLLTEGTASTLPHLCMLHSRLVSCWTIGETPAGTLLSVYRKMTADIGLSQIAAPAPSAKPNRFLINHSLRPKR